MAYDIGDPVTLGITTYNDTTGVAEDAASVTASLTLPTGATSSLTVTHVALTGVYTVTPTATVEGIGVVTFTITGTATVLGGIDVQQFEVVATPGLPDLFTLAELASRLQVETVDTASAALAHANAHAIVRSYTKQRLTRATYTGVLLPIIARGWHYGVPLPQRPVTAVTSLSVGGTAYVAGTDYAWDGWSPVIDVDHLTWTTATFQTDPMATVTYTAGYTSSDDLALAKGVALAVAAREYDNPTSLVSRSIDDYSETTATRDGGSGGLLLDAEMRVLDHYRIRAGSL